MRSGSGEPGAGIAGEGVRQREQCARQRGRVLGHLARVGDHHRQQSHGLGQGPMVNRRGQLDVDP